MADDGILNFRPPRSTSTFGVSGLLDENCRVFYDSIFTTRHLGRVADLLSARLHKAGPDELRLRALLLFLAYEGFRAQFPVVLEKSEDDEDSDLALRTPLTIECGIDGEKIVVGVSFDPHPSQIVDINGLEDRIRSGKGNGRIENALMQLLGHSPAVYFRRQPSSGRLELAATIGIRDKAMVTVSTGVLGLHEIPEDPEAAPKAAQYAELGDEDYEALLKEESKGRGDADDGDESSKKISGDEEDENGAANVGGGGAKEKDSKRKLSGKGRTADSSRVVSGEDEDRDDDQASTSSKEESEEDSAQKVGGRDPERKGRMKAAGVEEEEEEAEDEEEVRLGKGNDHKLGGRKLGIKAGEDEKVEAESDENDVRLGSSGKGSKARKIGVKSSQGSGAGEADSADEDEELRLGDASESGRKSRSKEEQAADDKAIREFDDSTVDPSNVSAAQVERYKEQINRLSRKLSDVEEDRAKWMRMVKSESTQGKGRGTVAGGANDAQAEEGAESPLDDGMRLKRLESAKRPNEAESGDQADSGEKSGDGKMRVRKIKKADLEADGESRDPDPEDEENSEGEEEQKKKPVGFLKRLFGGGRAAEARKEDESDKDADKNQGDSRSRSKSGSDEEKPKKKKKGFFGLGGDEDSDEAEKESEKAREKDKSETGSPAVNSKDEDQGDDALKKASSEDPAESAEDLAKDIESGTFHQKMEKAKDELEAIRSRMKDERVKAWADGMMADIMKEKARLGEMARNLNQAFRAREADFNRKSQFMKQEILNREDQIRKGHLAVARVREQLSLSNSNSERQKVQMGVLETQESAARQKFQAAERLVQVAKEETASMQRQVENMKQQALQSGSQGKKLELVQKELLTSKSQVEKALKLAEDMKRSNALLTEKLNATTQATSGAGGTEDLKRKLEAAGRLTAAHKKEAETFRTKMEGTLKEEARLRSEVTKLQAEMKRMKALSNMTAAPVASANPPQPTGTAPKKPGTPGGKAA